jgi:hypothetical protein
MMNSFARMATAAVAAVVVGAIGLALALGPLRSGTGAVATPLPSPSITPSSSPVASPEQSPSATALPALTQTFTSPTHGLSVRYPASGWTVRTATAAWTAGVPFQDSAFADVLDGATNGFLAFASQPLGGKTSAAWITQVTNDPGWSEGCPVQTEPVTVDGAAGVLITHCPDTEVLTALVTTAGRGYVVVFYNAGDKARFQEILATMQLDPSAVPSASPS